MITFEIQRQLIEHAATWFLPNILVDSVATELIETDSVGEWFGAGLQGEGGLHIPQGVPGVIHITF